MIEYMVASCGGFDGGMKQQLQHTLGGHRRDHIDITASPDFSKTTVTNIHNLFDVLIWPERICVNAPATIVNIGNIVLLSLC